MHFDQQVQATVFFFQKIVNHVGFTVKLTTYPSVARSGIDSREVHEGDGLTLFEPFHCCFGMRVIIAVQLRVSVSNNCTRILTFVSSKFGFNFWNKNESSFNTKQDSAQRKINQNIL